MKLHDPSGAAAMSGSIGERRRVPAPMIERDVERNSAGSGAGTGSDRTQRRWLQRGIAQAIACDGFQIHYQPRLSLVTGQIMAAETLLRWPHDKRGFISPMTFIPIAEQSGQIASIGGWVLRAACIDAKEWGGVRVSVSLSARQFDGPAMLTQVADALDASGMAPDCLELALSEAMLMNVDIEALLTLSAIRDLGVGVAMDDFGSAVGSLSMLRRLPLTGLKLDRSLIRDVPAEREDAAILRATVETGHALGLTLVAHGIETESQIAFLRGIGCDEGVGLLFSQPLPADQLRARLEREPQA